MTDARKRRLRASCGLVGAAVSALLAFGATTTRAIEPAKSTVAPASAQKPARPYWIELETSQRATLAPLADDWERLDGQTKKKWVEIARRYPRMSADEQQRTQQRMREWAMLTPEQRRVARDSFARVRALPPEQRAELMQRYRELPEAQKTELTKEGRASKTLTLPKADVTPSPRRGQMREGAQAANPAVVRKNVEAKTVPTTPPAGPAPAAPAPAVAPAVTEAAPATKVP